MDTKARSFDHLLVRTDLNAAGLQAVYARLTIPAVHRQVIRQ